MISTTGLNIYNSYQSHAKCLRNHYPYSIKSNMSIILVSVFNQSPHSPCRLHIFLRYIVQFLGFCHTYFKVSDFFTDVKQQQEFTGTKSSSPLGFEVLYLFY